MHYQLPTGAPAGDPAKVQGAVSVRSSAVAEAWAHPGPRGHLMDAPRAFVHRYVREAWRREGFLGSERTRMPLRRPGRRLVWILLNRRVQKERNTAL